MIAGALLLVAAACSDDDDAGSEVATTVSASAADAPTTVASTSTPAVAPGPTPAVQPPVTANPSSAPRATTAAPEPGPDPAVTFTEIASLNAPVDLTWRPGDDGLYVVEQAGRIIRVAGQTTTTVLDISELTEANGEQGLLGMAFDPTGEVAYINYNDQDGWTVIGEYPVDADGTFRTGDEARFLLEIEQPYPNHKGGDLTFGPDVAAAIRRLTRLRRRPATASDRPVGAARQDVAD